MGSDYRLVFDGDCGFCRYTVGYARALTGDAVEYLPYQEVLDQYPDLSAADFRASIWLFGENERRKGADAAFRTLEIGGRPALAWMYRRIPGMKRLSEWAYVFVSRHRRGFHSICRPLFGKALGPARFALTSELATRLIGLTFALAFWSYGTQILGLNGSRGILPAAEYLARAHQQVGDAAWWQVPTLFWLNDSDVALQLACWIGAAFGVLALSGLFVRVSLAICFLLYLSLQSTVGVFMSFQWDLLLLEAGFIGVLAVGGGQWPVWLARLTVFRFMFMGGMVKLLSGDQSWRDFTALDWHFYTQPLPNPLSWYLHNGPEFLRKALTGGTLFVEIFLPALIFLPRRLRQIGAVAFIFLEIWIAATGNYNFFNLLTIVLCLFLFDDRALSRVLPGGIRNLLSRRKVKPPRRAGAYLTASICALLMVCGAGLTWMRATQNPYPSLIAPLYRVAQHLRLVSGYGPFAVMTKQRDEIVIEGSADGSEWKAYELPYKPQALDSRPMQVAPHQPRLDWQLWFAALSDYRRETWFIALVGRLLEGSDDVEALFSVNPFEDAPPMAIRAQFFRYRFTSPEERAESGNWWVREPLPDYLPPVHLRPE